MNLGERILSDLVVALIELYPNVEVETIRINYLLFYLSIIFKKLN
jgi:hypothetical protein